MSIQARQTQQQKLLLAPNVTLALEILRMPMMELQGFLEQQAEENPLLELEMPQPESESESEAETAEAASKDAKEASGADSGDDDLWWTYRRGSDEAESPDEDSANTEEWLFNQRLVTRESLHESLYVQWGCQMVSSEERRLGELIINNLDEHGYLEADLAELAKEAETTLDRLEKTLGLIQRLDPPGVAARNLRECLMLQLECANTTQTVAYAILRDHFGLFTQRRISAIAKAVGKPVSEVERACLQIKQLNPKPGRLFAGELPPSLIPDLVIRHSEGHYDVELNEQGGAQVSISRSYYRMLRDPRTPGEAKIFLMDKFRKASWLIKAIDERNATLLAIARCLISLQRNFLAQGPKGLKPLTQAQVAQLVGRHPSTVSRAISGKTIDTPFGVFRLEQLFASSVPQYQSEEGLSDATIKSELQKLLSEEDPLHPFSDAAIVKKLAQRHMVVARRTIAKYRATLNILPAHLRRQRR